MAVRTDRTRGFVRAAIFFGCLICAMKAWPANWIQTVSEVDVDRGVRQVTIQLGVALDLKTEFRQISKGVYLATALVDDGFADRDWQFTELEIDEKGQVIQGVSVEGSQSKGVKITIRTAEDYAIATKPQLDRSRIVFSVIPNKLLREMIRENQGRTEAYAVEIQPSSLLTSTSLPQELIENQVVYARLEKPENKRIGFFTTQTAAKVILQKVRGRYPKAAVVGATSAEQKNAQLLRLFPKQSRSRSRPDSLIAIQARAVTPETIAVEKVELNSKVEFTDELDRSVLDEAQQAYIVRDWDRAISLYTKAAEIPGLRIEALEKLGVSRERKQQHAQAKLVYQQFLVEFPNIKEARRVKQRLLSLQGGTQAKLRNAKFRRTESWSTNAFLSQYYRRHTIEIDGADRQVPVDAVFTNLNLLARKQTGSGFHEGRISAGHIWDFSDRDRSQKSLRLQKASWESYFDRIRTGFKLGRQSRYESGVLGRFDGITISHKQTDRLQWNTVGGYIVQSSYNDAETEQPFFGVSADMSFFDGKLELSPFFIQQNYNGILNRQAVGSNLVWLTSDMVVTAQLDYDIHHAALNNIYLSASYNLNSRWRIHSAVDQRRSPYLTTSNALIGQQHDDLSELERDLLAMELGDLAEDRTATSKSFRIGLDGQLSTMWRLSLDASASDYSSTNSSEGVLAIPARRDYYFSAQIRANNLLGSNSYSAVQMRVQSSDTADSTTLILNSRFRMYRDWLLHPRLIVSQRVFDANSYEQFRIRPSVRLDYSGFNRFRIEAEVGYDWFTRETFRGDIDTTGLFLRLGYRARF